MLHQLQMQERRMLRYTVVAAAALVLLSGIASAEPVGPTTSRQTDHSTVIKKNYINHRGEMVTKRTMINGNVVARSRTVHDPMTGERYTRMHTRTTE
jgi:hypothetical protein